MEDERMEKLYVDLCNVLEKSNLSLFWKMIVLEKLYGEAYTWIQIEDWKDFVGEQA